MQDKQTLRYDVAGYESVTAALRELVNQYPGLTEGDEIAFAVLDEDGGKAMFPVTGGVIESERKSVTGKVRQICRYPFYVIYRVAGATENRKASIKEWLDKLGEWLERRPVLINGERCQLAEYPELTDGRMFLDIERQTPAYLDNTAENKAEDWAISLTARYENNFLRR